MVASFHEYYLLVKKMFKTDGGPGGFQQFFVLITMLHLSIDEYILVWFDTSQSRSSCKLNGNMLEPVSKFSIKVNYRMSLRGK